MDENGATQTTWPIARLGDLCEIIIGRTPRRDVPDYWRGNLPWVSISDLTNGVVRNTRERITQKGAEESGARLIKEGSLLFSFKLTIGKMAFAGSDLYTNEAIAALVPKNPSQLDKHYLLYALKSVDLVQGSAHAVKGKTLNQDSLAGIRIPLPGLDEQMCIVATLGEQLVAVQQARTAAEDRLEAAKTLRAAHIREVFESDVAKRWPIEKVGNIASLITDGPHVTPNYVARGIPFVTVRNIVNRRLDFSETRFITERDHDQFKRRGHAEPGDILYTKDGTLGIPCVVDTEREFSFFVSVALIKLRHHLVNPYFIAMALESPDVLKQVEFFGAGAGLKHLVLKSIRSLEVRLPSLVQQQRLAVQLDEKIRNCECLQMTANDQLKAIAGLPSMLVRRAFSPRFF